VLSEPDYKDEPEVTLSQAHKLTTFIQRNNQDELDNLDDIYKIKQEELEYKESQRLKADKRQIEKEIQNLIKLAEAQSKDNDEDVQALFEVGEEEVQKINIQSSKCDFNNNV
jgi:hypothetical protein